MKVKINGKLAYITTLLVLVLAVLLFFDKIDGALFQSVVLLAVGFWFGDMRGTYIERREIANGSDSGARAVVKNQRGV